MYLDYFAKIGELLANLKVMGKWWNHHPGSSETNHPRH